MVRVLFQRRFQPVEVNPVEPGETGAQYAGSAFIQPGGNRGMHLQLRAFQRGAPDLGGEGRVGGFHVGERSYYQVRFPYIVYRGGGGVEAESPRRRVQFTANAGTAQIIGPQGSAAYLLEQVQGLVREARRADHRRRFAGGLLKPFRRGFHSLVPLRLPPGAVLLYQRFFEAVAQLEQVETAEGPGTDQRIGGVRVHFIVEPLYPAVGDGEFKHAAGPAIGADGAVLPGAPGRDLGGLEFGRKGPGGAGGHALAAGLAGVF